MLYNKEVIIKELLLTWNIYNQKNKYSGSSPEDKVPVMKGLMLVY